MTEKKTKIIATLGPATLTPKMVENLVAAGADVFRLNFSHGSREQHGGSIDMIRAVSRKTGVPCGILADLQGPKIRTGRTAGDAPVILREGSDVTLTVKPAVCTDTLISVDYRRLAHEIKAGQRVLINDGAVALTVQAVNRANGTVRCRVLNTGAYSSRKGVNFPDVRLSIPSMTAKDRADLAFILGRDVDYVALSFVRSGKDVAALRRLVTHAGSAVRLIAKIEKPEAARDIGPILAQSDGIMVARGDLGVETSPEQVPIVQKNLIAAANAAGRQVIVATQMLESMIKNPLPTRAESTDVANAILDGADCLMLSGETSVGDYPQQAVAMMAKIARATEASAYVSTVHADLALRPGYPPHSVCEAAATASADLGGAPVVVFTMSGDTAFYLSKIRNRSRIFAFSPDPRVVTRLSLAWNVTAMHLPMTSDLARLQERAERMLLGRKLVRRGDLVVVVSGAATVRGATSSMRVKRVGQE